MNASRDAILSAGISPKDIGAGYISNVFGAADKQVHIAPVIMSNLGIPYVPGLTIESACGSGSVMLREAFANVYAGFYDCVLAVGVEKITHTGTTRKYNSFLGPVLIFFTKVVMALLFQVFSLRLPGPIFQPIKPLRRIWPTLQ